MKVYGTTLLGDGGGGQIQKRYITLEWPQMDAAAFTASASYWCRRFAMRQPVSCLQLISGQHLPRLQLT